MNKLANKKFYVKGEYDPGEYTNAQISRHAIKKSHVQPIDLYKMVADAFKQADATGPLICMGTRNNNERDRLHELTGMHAESCDIAPESMANHVMNFSHPHIKWNKTWGSLYSNSIDHAADVDSTFKRWYDIMIDGGIMIIAFSLKDVIPSASDCTTFTEERCDKFFKKYNVLQKFINYNAMNYVIKVKHANSL